MYFERGKLTCAECGQDKTPLSDIRVNVVFSDYREKIIRDIQKIIDGLPENILQEIVEHTKYLKWRESQNDPFA